MKRHQFPENSTDTFKSDITDRHIHRPNVSFDDGKYSILGSF